MSKIDKRPITERPPRHEAVWNFHIGGYQVCEKWLYEQGEDRYWETVRPRVKVVYDRDDTRTTSYGVYYTAEKPLTLAARAKK